MIHWQSARFVVDGIPPSKNQTNWKSARGRMSTKTKWRDIFVEHLIRLDLPRPLPRVEDVPVIVKVTLVFTSRAKDPECRNYLPAIEECICDALRRSDDEHAERWVGDDKDKDVKVRIGQAEERHDRRHMIVEIMWMELEDKSLASPFYGVGSRVVAQLPTV